VVLRGAISEGSADRHPEIGSGAERAGAEGVEGVEEGSRMAWVITRLCRDCVDQSCVEVCPVDCIYAYDGDDDETFPNQLYIDPEECINCGVCEPECPWEAIFEDEQVPVVFQDDIALNAKIMESKQEFSVPEVQEKDKPTPEQIEENKEKWGYSA
jgi:ferredoxin